MLSRLPVLLTAAVLGALVGGCDLDDDPKRDAPVVAVPQDPFAAEAGDTEGTDDGEYSVDEVIQAYANRIGLTVQVRETVPESHTTLIRAPGSPELGPFAIYVAADGQAVESFTAGPGTRIRFGNVVLEWAGAGEGETDERFQRLVDPLESLGDDAIERPAMRPCEELVAPSDEPEAGPSSGSTCRLGPQVVTFGDPETTLSFGGVEVELVGVGPGGLKSPEVYDVLPNPREAKGKGKPRPIASKNGQFLAVRLKLDNGAEQPLGDLKAGLVINGVLHRSDLANAFHVDREPAPLPLAPGDSKELVLLFDLPGPTLAELTSPGTALVFMDPRNPHIAATPISSPTVTRLRLFK